MAYIIGLDLGIASVGWSVIDPGRRIIDLGVRAFKKAETGKTGDPLNLVRRQSRLTRRRIYRRAHRLNKLLNYFIEIGLIASKDEILKNAHHENPWELRTRGLEKPLTNNQLARVIYHICKHRGFYWASSADQDTDDSGKVKKSLSVNKDLMFDKEKKKTRYKTVGQMIYSKYPECQRNKAGDYSKSLPRDALAEELKEIFKFQKERSSCSFITDEFYKKILGSGDRKSGFLWEQRPALQGDALLKMVGHCRFEPEELRAPVANYWVIRHVWLTKVLNLRVYGSDFQERSLNDTERNLIANTPLEVKSDIKYSTLTSVFVKAGLWKKGEFSYKGLDYSEKNKTNPENKIFCKSLGFNAIRKVLESEKLDDEWKKIRNELLSGQYERYNRIAYVLTVYKEDDSIKEQLSEYEDPKVIEALLPVRFKEFSALSEKSLKKIVPFMEQGQSYDEACLSAGYTHYKQSQRKQEKSKYLPPLFSGREPNGTLVFNGELGDIPRNPVVLRVINQARKVLNAIVKKYGSPLSVHIELARDLSKSFDERKKIENDNKNRFDKRKGERENFIELFGEGLASGKNFEKFSLYNEQCAKSAYSGTVIDIHRLFESGYVEVDHILPYSRSYDDSQSNKVLVLTKENRDKGNQIPYEFFSNYKGDRNWEEFEAWVKSCKGMSKKKKANLLRHNLTKDAHGDFLERNLNDTRYACKFFKNYIDRFLLLDPSADRSGCVVVAGAMTAFLRKHWGLSKNREENDRHHALDATVIACCSRSMIQKIGSWYRSRELLDLGNGYIEPPDAVQDDGINSIGHISQRSPFPYPWELFREEVNERVFASELDKLKDNLKNRCGYSDEELKTVRTLFVSRTCEKIGKGALHKATLYRQTDEMAKENIVVKKVPLQDLKYADISEIVDAATRNKNLCNAIRNRFESYCHSNGKKLENLSTSDYKKIFSEDAPMHMPNSEGIEDLKNPIIKSVRIKDKVTGFHVHGGLAENINIIRVDVFKKNNKYYCIPIYPYQKKLSCRACIANKDEREWTLIDDTYEWCFSLRQNDLIRIFLKRGNKNISYFGYFNSFDRATGAISILLHDRQKLEGTKNGEIRGIGIKTALSVKKYQVDVLGNYYLAQPEPRRELA